MMGRFAINSIAAIQARWMVTGLSSLLLLAAPGHAQNPPSMDEANTKTPALINHIKTASFEIHPPHLAISAEVFDVHFAAPDLPQEVIVESAKVAERSLAEHRAAVRLSHGIPEAKLPLVAGKSVGIPLTFDIQGFAAGEEIYALVFVGMRGGLLLEMVPDELVKKPPRLYGMTVVAPRIELDGVYNTRRGGGSRGPGYIRFNAASTRIYLESELGAGGVSTFALDASSFPVHALLPTEPIRDMVMALPSIASIAAAKSPEEAKETLAALDSDDKGMLVAFNMVFLTSAGGPDIERLRAAVNLTLPNLPFGYDSLVLLPVAVRRERPGHAVIIADTERMPLIRVPVTISAGQSVFPQKFIRSEPELKQAEALPLPKLEIVASDNRVIDPGREIKKSFRVRHGPAPVGAEIYIVLQPAVAGTSKVFGTTGDRLASYETTTDGIVELNACRTALGASFMRIRQSPISVESAGMLSPALEAGRLGRVTSPSGGDVEGTITFTAPAIAGDVYNAVRATPLLFVWSDQDGMLCARSRFEPSTATDLPTRPLGNR